MNRMREKKRYLLVKFDSPSQLSAEEAKHLVYESLFQLVGEYGASKAALQFKNFDAEGQRASLKCASAMLEQVIAALALKRTSKGREVAMHVISVSGSASKIEG